MALTQKLQLRQSHALVMTPQLMQAIKLLQLSNLDLVGYVESELERNPLLERAGESEAEDRSPPADTAGPGDWPEGRTAADGSESEADDTHGVAAAPPESPDAPVGYADWAGTGSSRHQDGVYNLEAFVSAERTLAHHLAEQLALAVVEPARRLIGQYLIDLVDEAGYLAGDVAHVAEKLGAAPADVEAMLDVLQSFDPPGVAARDLTECLAIQLRERNRLDPAMQALLAHLDLLARRDLPGLRKACGVGEEDLLDMIGEVRKLNPKPGLAFGSTQVQPIVPDVFVRPAPSGGFVIEL